MLACRKPRLFVCRALSKAQCLFKEEEEGSLQARACIALEEGAKCFCVMLDDLKTQIVSHSNITYKSTGVVRILQIHS